MSGTSQLLSHQYVQSRVGKLLSSVALSGHECRNVKRYGHALLASSSIGQLIAPASEMLQLVNIHTGPEMRTDPTPVRNVRDGVVTSQKFIAGKPPVQYLEETSTFFLIPVDDRLNLLRKVSKEDISLTHHRTYAAHLKHKPLDYR